MFIILILVCYKGFHQITDFWITKPDWPFLHFGSILLQLILYGGILFAWIYSLIQWSVAFKCLGASAFRLAAQTLLLRASSNRSADYSLTSAILKLSLGSLMWAGLLAIPACWLKSELALYLSLAMFTLSVMTVVEGARPPSILVLAASNNHGFRLQARVHAILNPIEIAALLDRKIGHTTMFGRFLGTSTNFRTVDEKRWRSNVRFLMRSTALVIIDTRQVTAPLVDEMNWLLSDKLMGKTLLVAEENGRAPLLEVVSPGLVADISERMVSEERLHTQLIRRRREFC